MLNKIFAKVTCTTNGYMSDTERMKAYNIMYGETYEVSTIEINGFSTDVYLNKVGHIRFNSVHFKFFNGDGGEIDIFSTKHPKIIHNYMRKLK